MVGGALENIVVWYIFRIRGLDVCAQWMTYATLYNAGFSNAAAKQDIAFDLLHIAI